MTIKVEAIVGTTTYSLSDAPFRFVAEDNVGLAPARRLTESGPMQHGETDLGFRLQARTLQLVVLILARSVAEYQQSRELLLDVFKPRDTPVVIQRTDEAGNVRRIDAHSLPGSLVFGASDRYGSRKHKAGASLYCPDPTWYDPDLVNIPFQQLGGGAGLTFNLFFPFTMGASLLDQITVVSNGGTWLSYPQIRVTGPIGDCHIENTTTGEALDFLGTTIGNGDWYDIDCRYGYKTVIDSAGANQIDKLTTASDLATFHLEPGANSIRVTGSGITEATRIELNFFKRYIGV